MMDNVYVSILRGKDQICVVNFLNKRQISGATAGDAPG
jgi:hypothetical protein